MKDFLVLAFIVTLSMAVGWWRGFKMGKLHEKLYGKGDLLAAGKESKENLK
jgi:hypothetical protein